MTSRSPVAKKTAEKEDSRLTRLSKFCLALPNAQRTRNGSHATFSTGSTKTRKVFAYFLNNHHADGIVAVACKVGPGDNQALVAAQPDRFYLPAYIGPRGWIALRADVGKVDWAEVAELVQGSHAILLAGTKPANDRTLNRIHTNFLSWRFPGAIYEFDPVGAIIRVPPHCASRTWNN